MADSLKSRTQELVAIKILTAEATFVQGRVADELGILQRITSRTKTSTHPGHHHVVTIQDCFCLKNIETSADHLCLVQNVYGVLDCKNRRLPDGDIKRFAHQMLLGLDFLHRECNVTHTGVSLLFTDLFITYDISYDV